MSAIGLTHEPGHLIDIMATCVDVGGAKYPTEFHGQPIQPLEGRSLVPTFTGQPIPREALFGEHEGNAAIRVGDWKLVRLGRGGSWELYNLKSDRSEQHNRAAEHPDRVKELAAEWDAWAQRAHVIPYPQPNAQGNGQPKNNGNKQANTKQKAAA